MLQHMMRLRRCQGIAVLALALALICLRESGRVGVFGAPELVYVRWPVTRETGVGFPGPLSRMATGGNLMTLIKEPG